MFANAPRFAKSTNIFFRERFPIYGMCLDCYEISYIMIKINFFITGDNVPTMGELYTNVVHQYAAEWEQLGLKLGLEDYHIANISKDNAHNPDRSVTCCRTVLEKWLQIVPSPTWGKLDDVIVSLTTAPLQSTGHKGM